MAEMRFACLAAVMCAPLVGQNVDTRDGNVFLAAPGGGRTQLTFENRDLYPVISADGRWVAFVRIADPENDVTVEGDQLCVVAIAGGREPQCGSAHYQEGEPPLGGFVKPAWTADNRSVYFLADFSSNSEGLCRFDTATGKAVFVSPASEFAIVKAGRWRGNIAASVETRESGGIRYPFFVLSAAGEKLARVGEPNEKLDAVVARIERAP